jgi:threonine synthase
MDHVVGFKCSLCGAEYGLDQLDYVCPHHGDAGNLDMVYDYARLTKSFSRAELAAKRDPSIWRYMPLLPVQSETLAALVGDSTHPLAHVGGTPLYAPGRLRQAVGLPRLYLKDDSRNPSASFKDRASAVAIVKAVELGREVVCAASTGNAASSLACLSAGIGLRNIIFVPRAAPEAKIAQLLIFGATVLAVEGNYDAAFELSIAASKEFGWYCRNTGYNPYTVEGKKTVAFEICEQLGWQAPDWVCVPVGDGNIITGVHKGLQDLLALGWIERMPRLLGVQSELSAACANAWQAGTATVAPVKASTIADSISVDMPRDGVRAVRAVDETGGAYVTVSDDAILQAISVLGKLAGVFAEPAGAIAYAGLLQALAQGLVSPEETIVVLVTGNGLKDVRSAIRVAGEPVRIEPALEKVRRALGFSKNT